MLVTPKLCDHVDPMKTAPEHIIHPIERNAVVVGKWAYQGFNSDISPTPTPSPSTEPRPSPLHTHVHKRFQTPPNRQSRTHPRGTLSNKSQKPVLSTQSDMESSPHRFTDLKNDASVP